MKHAFIERHRRLWPICVQCRVLHVSVSGFHQHLARREDIANRRHLGDEALLVHVGAVYAENRRAQGWPRHPNSYDVFRTLNKGNAKWRWPGNCGDGARLQSSMRDRPEDRLQPYRSLY